MLSGFISFRRRLVKLASFRRKQTNPEDRHFTDGLIATTDLEEVCSKTQGTVHKSKCSTADSEWFVAALARIPSFALLPGRPAGPSFACRRRPFPPLLIAACCCAPSASLLSSHKSSASRHHAASPCDHTLTHATHELLCGKDTECWQQRSAPGRCRRQRPPNAAQDAVCRPGGCCFGWAAPPHLQTARMSRCI